MSKCNIDHSLEDVRKKFEEQASFLQTDVIKFIENFLKEDKDQATLNELFHLLKKYDLANEEEQNDRNEKILQL